MLGNRDMHIQGPQINQFNNISPQKIPRSAFRRDFTRRGTLNTNDLVPIFCDEILPGDDVNLKMTAMVRMTTPIKPLMDNLYLETFWFFIPNRLVWSNWKKFQGEQINPGDSTTYTIPVLNKNVAPMSTTGFLANSIYDNLGLPILVTNLADISALYNRAYDLCWNEWFRDENLQNSITVPTGDGPDDPALYTMRKRNKRKDYFTSALPWPQKGDAVSIGLAGTVPLISTGNVATFKWNSSGTTSALEASAALGVTTSTPITNGNRLTFGNLDEEFNGLVGDLDGVSAITINALRQAALYQQILELDARGGTRYVEAIYSRFGVVSPDFRLQRPELIGQGHTRINIYAVPQTAPTSAGETPQGNLAAFSATTIQGDHGCRYSATEHGMIIGLANVRADLTYQQGVPKKFTRSTRLDFYEPLQNGLGEQAILNREIFAQGTSADTQAFGYQERFAEYRFFNSEITGTFRSNAPQTIDVWHLSQDFGALPALNSSFIEENVPMDRILAVTTEPQFYFDASYAYNHVRPMPIRSNPGIDRL